MEIEKNNYHLCYEDLCKEFAKHDPKEMADNTGAYYDSKKKQFTLTYLYQEYLISYPEGNIMLKKEMTTDGIDVMTKILLLF